MDYVINNHYMSHEPFKTVIMWEQWSNYKGPKEKYKKYEINWATFNVICCNGFSFG